MEKFYTIKDVAERTGISAYTLRYYDKEGLFPGMERRSGIRRFSEKEVEALKVIECLKASGLEIRDIRKFMQWCTEGPSTYRQRKELFEKRRAALEEEMERLNGVLNLLRYKCWYYETAIEKGSEDFIEEMLPDQLPPEIQEMYDNCPIGCRPEA